RYQPSFAVYDISEQAVLADLAQAAHEEVQVHDYCRHADEAAVSVHRSANQSYDAGGFSRADGHCRAVVGPAFSSGPESMLEFAAHEVIENNAPGLNAARL